MSVSLGRISHPFNNLSNHLSGHHLHLKFTEWKIVKKQDIGEMQSCLIVQLFLKGKLPQLFKNYFQKSSKVHSKEVPKQHLS